jgi:hypothetical protein
MEADQENPKKGTQSSQKGAPYPEESGVEGEETV